MFRRTVITLAIASLAFSTAKAENLAPASLPKVEALGSWVAPALPPLEVVMPLLTNSTRVQTGLEQKKIEQANSRLSQQSPYEWEALVATRHRNERLQNLSQQDYEIGISRTVRIGSKAKIDQQMSGQYGELAHLTAADAWHETARTLNEYWFELRYQQARVALLHQLADATLTFSKQQQRRFELGEISATDSQQSRLDYQAQLAQLQAAQLDEQRAAAALQEQFPGSSALIQGQKAPQSMENRLEEPLLTDSEQKNWIDRMIEENHGLELARVQSELAASQASRKAAEKLADPTLALTYSRERNNAEQILGLQVNFPIGGAKRSEMALQAQSQAEQFRLAFELANRGAQTQATLTTQAYTQAAAAWKIYASTQQAQLDLFQKQLRAYSLSEISQFELQAARLRTAQVQLDALKARLDAEKAAARLLIDSHVLWAAPESIE